MTAKKRPESVEPEVPATLVTVPAQQQDNPATLVSGVSDLNRQAAQKSKGKR